MREIFRAKLGEAGNWNGGVSIWETHLPCCDSFIHTSLNKHLLESCKAVFPATKVQRGTKQIKIPGADNPDAVCSSISGKTDPKPVSRSLRRLSVCPWVELSWSTARRDRTRK